jgi:hypothetical protein
VRKSTAPPTVDIDGDGTDEWSGSAGGDDYPLPANEDHYLPVSSGEEEDTDYKLAVRDSLREEMEAKARKYELEKNIQQNKAVDDWLQAVQDVDDHGSTSVKAEPSSPPASFPQGKGKSVFIDLTRDKK